MESTRSPAGFSSPPPRKSWADSKKRKCSFGSEEKKDRKQFNRHFSGRKFAQENLDQNLSKDVINSPLGGSWADEVENQEKVHTKTGRNTRSKKQLDLSTKLDDNISIKRALQPILTDPHRLNQRQKQLDMGKNTLGYDTYNKNVTRTKRNQTDPWTPDKYQTCSTRSWQGQMKVWRRRLHMWDPEDNQTNEDPFSTSISFNSEGDTFEQDSEGFQSESCSQSSDDTRVKLEDNSFDEDIFGSLGHHIALDILPL